jgi:hypothetical protein
MVSGWLAGLHSRIQANLAAVKCNDVMVRTAVQFAVITTTPPPHNCKTSHVLPKYSCSRQIGLASHTTVATYKQHTSNMTQFYDSIP